MAERKQEALAVCARSDPKFKDRVVIRADLVPEHRPCAYCGEDLLVAPSTAAMEKRPDVTVTYACNPCGQAQVAQRGTNKLGIAPGALPGKTPDERRRRNTLEAHGFRDMKEEGPL